MRKVLTCVLLALCCSLTAWSQQTEIEYEGNASDPHLELKQIDGGDQYSRIWFTNNYPDVENHIWSIRANSKDKENSDMDFRFFDGSNTTSFLNLLRDAKGDNLLLTDARVGIGTDSPTEMLHLVGNGYMTGTLGLGVTSPKGKLDVAGNIAITSSSQPGTYIYDAGNTLMAWFRMFSPTNPELQITNHMAGGEIAFRQDISTFSIFDDEGNLGIGMVNAQRPSAKLDVSVGVLASGAKMLEMTMNTLSDDNAEFIRCIDGGTNKFRVYSTGAGIFSGEVSVGGGISGQSNIATDFQILQNGANNANTAGLRLQDDDGSYWTMYTDSGDDLTFNDNGTFRAQIQDGTGSFNITSDKRLKENRKFMDTVLPGVLKLQPSWYNYKSDKKQQKTLGFFAQEVEAQFPDFVGTKEDGLKYLTYDYFGILAIKAIQELHGETVEKDEKIEALESEMKDLQSQVNRLENLIEEKLSNNQTLSAPSSTTAVQDLTLAAPNIEQNNPNPFRGMTNIRYYLPDYVQNAQIQIMNANGIVIKTQKIEATGHGNIRVNVEALAAGNYSYSLIIDGQVTDSKQMVLVR